MKYKLLIDDKKWVSGLAFVRSLPPEKQKKYAGKTGMPLFQLLAEEHKVVKAYSDGKKVLVKPEKKKESPKKETPKKETSKKKKETPKKSPKKGNKKKKSKMETFENSNTELGDKGILDKAKATKGQYNDELEELF